VNVPSPGLARNSSLDREGSSLCGQESGPTTIPNRNTKADASRLTRACARISSLQRTTGEVMQFRRPCQHGRARSLVADMPAPYSPAWLVNSRRLGGKAVNSRNLFSLAVAGTIVAGVILSPEPAYAGRRAFIGGLVGGAVAGAMLGSAIAASSPHYYYGRPAYFVPPPLPPVYPVPVYSGPVHYPPPLCPAGYLCR
jgi:hypothetical protein